MTIRSLRLFRHLSPTLTARAVTSPHTAYFAPHKACINLSAKVKEFSKAAPGLLKIDGKAQEIEDLPLHPKLKTNLRKLRIRYISPLQETVLPELLQGNNAFLISETGSGKTLLYLIAVCDHVLQEKHLEALSTESKASPSIVILTPSASNGRFIFRLLRLLLLNTSKVKMLYEFSGQPPEASHKLQKQGCHILVSSPVRLLEKVEENVVSLTKCKFLVLDDMGQCSSQSIINALQVLLKKHLPAASERQTVLAGAGFVVPQFTLLMGTSPTIVRNEYLLPQSVQHRFRLVTSASISRGRFEALEKELERLKGQRGIIFCNRIEVVKRVEAQLFYKGYKTTPFHNKLGAELRYKALFDFDLKRSDILVSTAMGCCVDFTKIDFVINYEVPSGCSYYIHQVGRCGRLGQPGTAITIGSKDEYKQYGYYLYKLLRTNNLPLPAFGKSVQSEMRT